LEVKGKEHQASKLILYGKAQNTGKTYQEEKHDISISKNCISKPSNQPIIFHSLKCYIGRTKTACTSRSIQPITVSICKSIFKFYQLINISRIP
jgi:hypothetical protein